MNTLDRQVTKLLQHLAIEEQLLQKALKQLSYLHEVLLRGDLQALVAAQPTGEELAAELRQLQSERQVVIEQVCIAVGIASHQVTLSQLATHLSEPWAEQLRVMRMGLSQLVKKIAALQGRNANIIAHLRSFICGIMSTLTGVDSPVRYGPSGVRLPAVTGQAIQASG
jgi:uncharacterized protein YaaW (UPF0174 family)